MSQDGLDAVGGMLSSMDGADIMRAMRAATTCVFREAHALDQAQGLDAFSSLENTSQIFLDLSADAQSK